MHGMPAWMLKAPTPVTEPETKNATMFCQLWPPRDDAEYGEFVGKMARQISAIRKYCFPYMRKNYYQIHWEPDWHWRGSPEEFVQMYKTAYEAIHRNDPDAVLTGANYGVFAKGNTLLDELFAKGLGNYLDGITFHAYRLEGPLEDYMIGEMRRLVAMKREYLKPEARMFQTEWGESYPTEYVVPAIPRQELLREVSANLRGHLIILGEGADTTFFFYAVDHTTHGFGLVYNLDFPQTPFGPTRIAPKPWAMAACTMTRLLEGTQSLGSLEYLGDGAYGYVFQRGPELLAALWTSDEKPRTVRLNAGAARVTIIDCMGHSKTVETERGEFDLAIGPIPVYVTGLSPESVAMGEGEPLVGGTPIQLQNGPYRLQRGGEVRHFEVTSERKFRAPADIFGNGLLSRLDAESGYPLESRSLKMLKPFEVDKELKRTGPDEYQVAIRNHTGDTIRGSLNGTQEVTLPPHAVTMVAFSAGAAGGDMVTAEFKSRDGESQSVSMKKSGTLPAVHREKAPPVIDGRLEDWRLEDFTPMREKANLAFAKAPWTGPGDFSVRYAFAYDATNFYFAITVADDRHGPPLKEDEPWRGDSMQLVFGLAPDVRGRTKQKRTFSFELGGDGLARVKSLDALVPPAVNKVFRPDELQVKVVRDDSALQTVYEGAIPWALITADGSKPDYIGLGGLLNDADTEGEITGDARKTMNIGSGGDVLFTENLSFMNVYFKRSGVTNEPKNGDESRSRAEKAAGN
jgi:hypothetical protein